MIRKISITIIPLILSLFPLFGITSPEQFLGFRVGADRKLADYQQIVAYLQKLDQESANLQLLEIGRSTQNRPIVMAVISSEQNLSRLDHYKSILKKLRDPRSTPDTEAQKLTKEGKVFVLITCNLHSTEIASAQMALEFSYKLVTGDSASPMQRFLDDVVLLLIPSSNPDGTQMVCDWYKKYLGTPFEGGRMPWLYHPYAGHDNNRDWYMFNLPETRAISQVLYHDWLPQIHLDEHQMGSTGARMFIPPFMDPTVPQIQPLLWRSVALCGTNMAFDLEREGYSGVVHRRSFTGWWIGACDDTSWLHNVVGLLSEGASVKIASPIYVDPIEVDKTYSEKRIDFPNPWPGGWWRLRDLVDYELTLSLSLLKTASLYREEFLVNFHRMAKTSIEKREKNEPYAYIVPVDQQDPWTARRMLEVMRLGGVEINRARSPFTADGRQYPTGTAVILTSQPYKPYTLALLERQKYPDLREREEEPPIPPYDNAGWTLPLQMGVATVRIEKPFSADLEPAASAEPVFPRQARTGAFSILDPRSNGSYELAFQLLKENIKIFRSSIPIQVERETLPPGAFVVPRGKSDDEQLEKGAAQMGNAIHSAASISDTSLIQLRLPRIAIYQSWAAGMDEGWTRYVLDDFAIPYTIIHNDDFQAKAKTPLTARFDVVILPSENPNMIKDGKPDPDSRWSRYFTPLPEEYVGGIGKEGVDSLKTFVGKGGTLITLCESSNLVIKEFSPPVSDNLQNLPSSKFFCPSSIVAITVDPTSQLGYGMPENAAALFADGLAFSTSIPSGEWDRQVVATYNTENILLSGWLIGEQYLTRKAAVLDLKYKQGRICMMGIPVQNRAQTHGTYKFLFNALLYRELPIAEK